MRILIDKYIPFLQGVLDDFAEVCMLDPEQFTPNAVHDADALIVRTRTRCDAALLEGSLVRFIATATIGTDHIDHDYCRSRNIRVVSCPGCNAQAVCDYIEEALNESSNLQILKSSNLQIFKYSNTQIFKSSNLQIFKSSNTPTIGVVGVGCVGSLVAKMAERRGLQVVLNDPPLGLNGDVTACDIITFHTPLTTAGAYPTYHLCDAAFLSRCKPDVLIINTARGGVVDEQALLDSGQPFVIDTWEGEPHINPEVLSRATLASMHIAGYSIEGKRNASRMCLDALCQHFALPALALNSDQLPQGDNNPGWLKRISDALKQNPEAFEQLRKEYKLR